MTAPSGTQFEIRLGDQLAIVTEVGATLRVYRVADRDVVVPYRADEIAPAVHGAVLVPWPNRLANGTYSFDGETYQVPINEPERNNANHGLGLYSRWTPVAVSDSAVTLEQDLIPQPGYPFPLRSTITYALAEDGLTVTATHTNRGSAAAPFGIGFHPWLSPGAFTIDECSLHVEASTWVQADERLLPVGERDIPAELDFSQPRVLGGTVIDDGYVNPPAGQSWVRLTDPTGVAACCWMSEGLQCWQVCTADGIPGDGYRSGVAAEPMSCTANAFQTGNRLVRLEPGQSHTATWGLCLSR